VERRTGRAARLHSRMAQRLQALGWACKKAGPPRASVAAGPRSLPGRACSARTSSTVPGCQTARGCR
jgi:hypothetical protein